MAASRRRRRSSRSSRKRRGNDAPPAAVAAVSRGADVGRPARVRAMIRSSISGRRTPRAASAASGAPGDAGSPAPGASRHRVNGSSCPSAWEIASRISAVGPSHAWSLTVNNSPSLGSRESRAAPQPPTNPAGLATRRRPRQRAVAEARRRCERGAASRWAAQVPGCQLDHGRAPRWQRGPLVEACATWRPVGSLHGAARGRRRSPRRRVESPQGRGLRRGRRASAWRAARRAGTCRFRKEGVAPARLSPRRSGPRRGRIACPRSRRRASR
jgi:hypothetical protein